MSPLNMFKKVITIFFSIVFIIALLYVGNGPGATPLAQGQSASPQTQSFSVNLSVLSEITISAPSNVTMTPVIYGITGNLGNPASGSTSFTVKTNNATGFNLTVHATTDPALATDTYSFSDYSVSGAGADYNWQSPSSGVAEFGFAVGASGDNGADATDVFKSGLGQCWWPGGPNDANHCWKDFNGTTPITIVNRTTNTGSAGVVETLAFRAESNAAFLAEDTYTATITVTATTN